jgi:hypothetical protein
MALFVAASLGWWRARKASDRRRAIATAGYLGWGIACAALLIATMMVLVRLPAPTDDWQAGGLVLSEVLKEAAGDDDAMIVDFLPFGDHLGHTTSLLDRYKALPAYWGWARQEPVSVKRQAQMAGLGEKHGRLWLLLDTTPEADPASTTERWLDENAFRVATQWLSPAMRLVAYAWPGDPSAALESSPLDLRVGDKLWLDRFGPACIVHSGGVQGSHCPAAGQIEVQAGDILTFALLWRAEQVVEQDYTVFVQVLDQSGQLQGQVDRPPVGGFRQTSTWKAGEVIDDRYGLALPRDIAPGRYWLIAGLYLPSSGERLAVSTADGAYLGDHALLTEFIVAEGDAP